MRNDQPQNPVSGTGTPVVVDGGLEATVHNAQARAGGAAILGSTSTKANVQRAKVLALLLQGPKTTVDLRQHGIMMPATRVHELKHEHNQNIVTELVALHDAEGILHARCARYHLVPATLAEATAVDADYALYEARKAEWIAQHPGASPDQYQAAIRAIAAACGV